MICCAQLKGVGSKSAFSLVNSLGFKNIIEAISFENKKLLSTAPGIGNKAASQIILDLQTKVTKLTWANDSSGWAESTENGPENTPISDDLVVMSQKSSEIFVQDTLWHVRTWALKSQKFFQ